MNTNAQVVIVGAGIVGVSTAYELVKGGMTDVLVIDQAELFRTGGSTSHAPGGVFQNNGSRTVSKFAQWSVETFRDLSLDAEQTYFPVGSLEIATTEARWKDLHRKYGYARSWGLVANLLSPAEIGRLLPLLDTSLIHGAIHIERDGIVRSIATVERMARRAEAQGASFAGDHELTAVNVINGRVSGIETSRGTTACEHVVLCGGIWGPLLGKIAGINIPLQPCAHPYVRTEPLAELRGLQGIVQPIWRHQDHSMYLWQDGEHLVIGNYRHEPVIVEPELFRNSSAELPFDKAVMEPGLREARRLVPAIGNTGLSQCVYGMFSFTPDGQSIIGEVAGIRGLWTAIAVWVTHSAGVGKALAQLMLAGDCELDLREVDVNRFAPHHASRKLIRARGEQQYREVYDIIHPKQQIAWPRKVRRAPWHQQQRDLGAYFFESNGWERPQWFEANRNLPLPPRGATRSGWNAIEWSPICAAEHVATRESCGLFDLSTFMRIEVSGPGALQALERVSCSKIDRPVGRVGYSLLLNEHGGIESDVTIARMAAERFMIMTGSASGPRDLGWIQRQTRDLPGVEFRDITSGWCAMGVWGPRAIDILSTLTDALLGRKDHPPYQARPIFIGTIPVLAVRMSYVGEDGFELHASTEYGAALWDLVWSAGQEFGLTAAGGAAMDSLRLERGFRALSTDLRAEYTPFEAGLDFAVDRQRTNYIGASALAATEPRHRLCCFVLDDEEAVFLGKEPILVDGRVAGYVSSANFGFTFGKPIAYGYLPTEASSQGSTVEIEYFGRRFPAVIIAEPVLPPTVSREQLKTAAD
jgi:dimethylglycine oxidase